MGTCLRVRVILWKALFIWPKGQGGGAMGKTYRYKVTANVRATFQYSASDFVEQNAKKVKELALVDLDKKNITSGLSDNLLKVKKLEILGLKAEKLRPCSQSFYETREC